MEAGAHKQTSKHYVLGKTSFAAISAVEGLKLTRDAELRLQRTSTLPPDRRRAETIQAFKERKRA